MISKQKNHGNYYVNKLCLLFILFYTVLHFNKKNTLTCIKVIYHIFKTTKLNKLLFTFHIIYSC